MFFTRGDGKSTLSMIRWLEYILTFGCYSDWHIDAVCDDEEKARKICSLIDNVWDTDIYDIIDDDRNLYDVNIDCTTDEIMLVHSWKLSDPVFNAIIKDCGIYCDHSDASMPHVIFRVRAKDEEHAKKIALDRYYIWKAEKEGVV